MSAHKQRTVQLTHLFRALADPTRLRLLHLMARREICVCYFVQVLDVPQPKVSRHLAYLRKAGLIAARRDGKWMHYRLATAPDPCAASILRTTIAGLRRDKQMQRDFERLHNACCGPQSLVRLLGAPLPVPSDAAASGLAGEGSGSSETAHVSRSGVDAKR